MSAPARDWLGLAAWRRLPDAQKGVLCILGVTFSFVCMDASAKALSATNDPFVVVWARYAFQAALGFLIFAPSLGRRLRSRRLGLQILRSALLFIATVTFFSALAVMPLIEVTAVAQAAPLAITALAALLLGEKVGPYRWAGVAVGFIGALVILRPGGFLDGTGWATLLPLGAAIAFAAFNIVTRMIGDADSLWTTFLYTGVVGVVAASAALPFFWSTPALSDAPWFAAVGVFGALGQLLLIVALGYAPASLLAPYYYTSLIWTAILAFALFGETPDGPTLVGATMIVAAGLYVRHRERVRAQGQDV